MLFTIKVAHFCMLFNKGYCTKSDEENDAVFE